ncbi:hypothetical protein Tco_0261063 [Tanacetum coccineum]
MLLNLKDMVELYFSTSRPSPFHYPLPVNAVLSKVCVTCGGPTHIELSPAPARETCTEITSKNTSRKHRSKLLTKKFLVYRRHRWATKSDHLFSPPMPNHNNQATIRIIGTKAKTVEMATLGANPTPQGSILRTARALIDVHGEEMTLRHDDQSVTFKELIDVNGDPEK